MSAVEAELVPCVVEGRLYEIGASKSVRFVDGIGSVHAAATPHTTLGDPVNPAALTLAATIAEQEGGSQT